MAFTIPMRVLIGAMVAAIVLIVAIVTLVITYTVALTSLRDIAEKYAVALADSARANSESMVLSVTNQLTTIGELSRYPGHMLPSDLSTADQLANWGDKYVDMFLHVQTNANFTLPTAGIVYNDGSAVNVYPLTGDLMVWRFVAANMKFAAINNNRSDDKWWTIDRRGSVVTRLSSRPPEASIGGDRRFSAYQTALDFFPGPRGFWFPMVVYMPTNVPQILMPAVKPVYNQSGHFLGLATSSLIVEGLSKFLFAIKNDPDTQAFAINTVGLIGSTHPAPYFRISYSDSTAIPPGCASQASTATVVTSNFTVVCFIKAKDYGYAPLAAAASQYPSLIGTPGQDAKLVSTGGQKYYVVSSSVKSGYRSFSMNVVFVMPEKLVIGDIVKGRNQAIGITAALFILTSAIAFLLTYLLLRPLTRVSERMHQTARLNEDDEEAELSNLTEVRELQKSYYNMNAAIKSFTRYVPRDVVTDLMQSGQLCEIKMENMRCSMLFTDIQGFTTICERVPVENLSDLVSQYFDIMSKIVMTHDGLIDKYIGDCIMAVWGAPFPLACHEFKSALAGLLLNRATLVEPLEQAFDEVGEVLGIRVGIHAGVVLAGNMGSSQRMNYTVIGDAVNLAARLESMNKQFGTRVMISEDTAMELGNIFVLRLLMSIAVVGKAQPVKVYDVVGINPGLTEKEKLWVREAEQNYNASRGDRLENSFSDTNSTHSKISVANSAAYRIKTDSYGLLVRALELYNDPTNAPVAATSIDLNFAVQFTAAVREFLNRNYAAALEAINSLERSFPDYIIGDRAALQSSMAERSATLASSINPTFLDAMPGVLSPSPTKAKIRSPQWSPSATALSGQGQPVGLQLDSVSGSHSQLPPDEKSGGSDPSPRPTGPQWQQQNASTLGIQLGTFNSVSGQGQQRSANMSNLGATANNTSGQGRSLSTQDLMSRLRKNVTAAPSLEILSRMCELGLADPNFGGFLVATEK